MGRCTWKPTVDSGVVLVSDVEVVPDAPGVALAGAAIATTVPPRAPMPNVNTAAALAMRVLIMRKGWGADLNETSIRG